MFMNPTIYFFHIFFNPRAKVINLKGDLMPSIDPADKFSGSLLFGLFAYVIACSERCELVRGEGKEMGARITKVVVRNREKQKNWIVARSCAYGLLRYKRGSLNPLA